uniref:Acyl-CoA thioester hydrolase n=1 Tax=uncultured Muribaculaceae bacterium TaxID=2301481 RepID=A0A6G8F3Q5_9BACT|nr:hypothetical protein Muribac1_0630 [uncultured Muribaculaceae bacterium]
MNPLNIPDLSLFHHSTPIQIRFNDVDVLGHVNNTVYFCFYDTGKAHYMQAVEGRTIDWQHVDAVIANIDCAFMAPILFQEKIEVLTTCSAIHDKSFRLLQIIREADTKQIKSMCESVMVHFDPASGRPTPIDPGWREAVEKFEGRVIPSEKK